MTDYLNPDYQLAMHEEHGAWVNMTHRLAGQVGIDTAKLNDSSWNLVIDAIRYWGEALVQLRLTQDSDTVERAFNEALTISVEGRP